MPFSPHHIKYTYFYHDVSLLRLTSITWLRWCLPSFFCRMKLFHTPHPLSILNSLEGSHYALSTLKEGGLIYINYFKFFCTGDLSLLSHLFISVWIHGYLFYTLSYNPMLHYLFSCSNCSRFGQWSFALVLIVLFSYCWIWKVPYICWIQIIY